MALASARRLPARTAAASASTGTLRLGADRGIRRGSLALADEAQHAAGGLRDRRPGPEDRLHARLLEERMVPRRDDAADDDDDVARARALELAHELGHERLVAPDCVEMPTTWTSFSTAWRATSSGVWKSVPMSTSKP